jgi:hypothetical protein
MTIYDHNFFEIFRYPKKLNLILRALYAGWGPDTRGSDLLNRILVLKKTNPGDKNQYLLSLPPDRYFQIRLRTNKGEGILAHIIFRNLRFDHKNPFKIVNITYKNAPQSWDFDLKNPHLGLQPSHKQIAEAEWLKKIHKLLLKFWDQHGRPPAKYEFLNYVMEKTDYHSDKEILRLLNLGLGSHWSVHFENHKTNPKARRCYYLYPIPN